MKSIMRIIGRVVIYDKRNWVDTLKPNGTESDHNGCHDVMGDGQTIEVWTYRLVELSPISRICGGIPQSGPQDVEYALAMG